MVIVNVINELELHLKMVKMAKKEKKEKPKTKYQHSVTPKN